MPPFEEAVKSGILIRFRLNISWATRIPPRATAVVDWPGKMLSPTIQIPFVIRGPQERNRLVWGKPPTQPRERLEWLIDLAIYKAFGLDLEEIETVESFFGEDEEEAPAPSPGDVAAVEEGEVTQRAFGSGDSPQVFGGGGEGYTFEAGKE